MDPAVSLINHPCMVCFKPTSTWCSRCQNVWYCSPEHLQSDWPRHCLECVPIAPREDQPRVINMNCEPSSTPPQGTCPTPLVHGYFPDSVVLTQGLNQAIVPPAPANNEREDIPPPDIGVSEPSRIQDLYPIDVANQGIVEYHPQPLANPAYVFPDVGNAQGIPMQVQPNARMNQEHNPFGFIPPHVAPGPVQAAFPHPFVHRIPTPNPPRQAEVENLRQLASHYLRHPNAQVSMVTMEAGTAGRIKVAVIFAPDF